MKILFPRQLNGLNWDPKSDVFTFEPFQKLVNTKVQFTRRGCSSLVPKFHDSMGLLMPFTLRGKILIQKCWTHIVESDNSKLVRKELQSKYSKEEAKNFATSPEDYEICTKRLD